MLVPSKLDALNGRGEEKTSGIELGGRCGDPIRGQTLGAPESLPAWFRQALFSFKVQSAQVLGYGSAGSDTSQAGRDACAPVHELITS